MVALSGGPDSIFVLKVLKALQADFNFEIHAYHLNHQLRESADHDENFVKGLCADNDIILHLETTDIATTAKEKGLGTEEAGRVKRYGDLKKLAEEIGTTTVITGHHLDDDIETVLMNFERGAGLNGLAGIKVRDGIFFRPLLNISKDEILKYLDDHEIPYCIDETNFIDDVSRNDMRINKIPQIEKILPDFKDRAELAIANLKASRLLIEGLVEYFLKDADVSDNAISISISKMVELFPYTRADLYMAIIKKLNPNQQDIYSYHLREIDQIIFSDGEKRTSFSGIYIIKSYDNLIFTLNEDYACECKFELTKDFDEDNLALDGDKVQGEIKFRKRLPGDVFETRGGRTKKLKEILIDEKIPKYKRDSLVIACDEAGIIYVQDLWLSKRVATDDHTKNTIYLRRYYEQGD